LRALREVPQDIDAIEYPIAQTPGCARIINRDSTDDSLEIPQRGAAEYDIRHLFVPSRSDHGVEMARDVFAFELAAFSVSIGDHALHRRDVYVGPIRGGVIKQHECRRYRALGIRIAAFGDLPLDDLGGFLLENHSDGHRLPSELDTLSIFEHHCHTKGLCPCSRCDRTASAATAICRRNRATR
jgi:hypothetical protein